MKREPRKILVTGAAGLLGSHLMAYLSRENTVVGVDRHDWWGSNPLPYIIGDLADEGFIHAVMEAERPDVVFHCAANVNVDACERDPVTAYAANAATTRAIATAAPSEATVVYITTDGIFRGDRAFVDESELPCPRTTYARSKLHGEWEVQLATPNHLIVRTNFYGWSSGRKTTSAEWLYHALQAREPITLFDDFFFTPIYVADLVLNLELLVVSGAKGIFHVCGADRVSKYQFGADLADVAGFSMETVRRGSLHEARLVAPRPPDMSLSSDRFFQATGALPPRCHEGLKRFVMDRERPLEVRFAL